MRRTAIVNLNTSRILREIKVHYLTVIFTIFFIVGIAVGAATVGKSAVVNTLTEESFLSYLQVRTNSPIYRIFFEAFFDIAAVALVVFLCGTSLVGVALAPTILLLRGFTYGAYAGYLYSTFSLKGIAFNALMLIPVNVITALALILCGKLAFNFSFSLVKSSIPKGQSVNLYYAFQYYCKRFCVMLLIVALAAAVDAIMSAAFLGFFVF